MESDIFRVCYDGRLDLLEALLNRDPSLVNTQDDLGGGYYPLSYAAYGGFSELCLLLLSRGAFINAKTDDGCTAVMLAAQQSKVVTVAFLLSRGADPTSSGRVQSRWAFHRGSHRFKVLRPYIIVIEKLLYVVLLLCSRKTGSKMMC